MWPGLHSHEDMGISQNRGTPKIPQNTIILSIGTPKKRTPIFRKPPDGSRELNMFMFVFNLRLQGLWFCCIDTVPCASEYELKSEK